MGRAIGELALSLEGERTQQKTIDFYQRLAGHTPNANYRCVSKMKTIVYGISSVLKCEGGLWGAWRGVGLLLRAVDFGGASEFTKPRNM